MVPVLQGVTAEELARSTNIEVVDARRLLARVHRDGKLPHQAFAGIRRSALLKLQQGAAVGALQVVRVARSSLDPFIKCVLGLPDGQRVESVGWPLEVPERVVVCVSSQAGCALGCAFCATGRLGLGRNLDAWEIVEQVRAMREQLSAGQRVHGVVFQGMGEPLANAEQVFRAIRVLSEPYGPAIDRRRMTVSTAGIPSGIRRLAREVPEVRLGVSLGSPRRGRREALMPIERRFPLDTVLEASADHAQITHLAPMFALALISGVTDTDEDAIALAELAKTFASRTGIRPRISLIPFNAVAHAGFEPPTPGRIAAFRERVHAAGVGTKLRYSGGGDVAAACGQLVGT